MTKVDEYQRRYYAALHGMQTGVAITMEEPSTGERDPAGTSPKHLRVGVNSAMVESSALAHLLIAKGVITAEEYFKALAEGMESEQQKYEVALEKRFGRKVSLR